MSERGEREEAREALIDIRNLTHRWGEGFELSVPEWRVARGERVALIGRSGAGKSTLMMILAGVIAPQTGEVWVLGAPLHAMSEAERRAWRARNIGLITQDFALLNHLSVADNIALPAQLELGAAPPSAHPQSSELINTLKLHELTTRPPDQLSQGERQRVALARALRCAPPLVLADEPTAHLDPTLSAEVLSLLKARCGGEAQADGGLVLITHDYSSLEDNSSHEGRGAMWHAVWTLNEGRLTLQRATPIISPKGSPQERLSSLDEPLSAPPLKPLTLSLMALKATRRYKGRALTLALALALTVSPPLLLSTLGARLEGRLLSRAQESPLVLGSPGSRFDLTLGALYFRGARLTPLTWGDLKRVYREGGVRAAPLHLGLSASGAPLVGTTLEYYELRGLSLSAGRLPQRVGEVVVGARAAERLHLTPGATVMSDQADLYNLAATYPITLSVVGVLEPTARPDDGALFTDVKTAWVIQGYGHGHEAARSEVGAGIVTRQTLTQEALKELHFHGDTEAFPLSAVLISPDDERASSLFKARAARVEGWRVITPSEVIQELLALIFKVKGALEMLAYLALALTLSLGVVVAWLSVQLRAHEWASLKLLGLRRAQVAWAAGAELMWVALITTLMVSAVALASAPLERLAWALLFGG